MTEGHPASDRAARAAASVLEGSFSGRVFLDAPLAPLSSLKVGGRAALLAEPENEEDLLTISSVLRGSGLPCLVIGRGTNVLLSDAGFPGIVIRLGKSFEWINGQGKKLEAGGATPLPQVANWAARRSLTGMEFAIAIPATVGGAVRMNAGAHHSQISEVLDSIRICRLTEGQVEVVPADLLRMRYRRTGIGSKDVVCSALFALERGERQAIAGRMREHRTHRLSTQPADQPNAGSIFRNPPGTSAGALIESAGLKTLRIGGAEVSGKHANFLLAHRGATAQDVYDLMAVVQTRVLESTGILLEPEVRIIGSFDTSRGEVQSA